MRSIYRPSRTFFEFLDIPLTGVTRVLLALLVAPLLLGFALPLWRLELTTPQHADPLRLAISSWRLEAGDDGRDLERINAIHRDLGMKELSRAELRDLDWLPFALGGLVLLGLRTSLLGNVRTLVDLAVLSGYVILFALLRFLWVMRELGSDVDPAAPGYQGPVGLALGTRRIGDVTVQSYPGAGSVCLLVFAVGVWIAMVWSLWDGRRRSRAAKEAARAGLEPLATVP